MPVEQAEIDRRLASLPLSVRQAVEKRLHMVTDAASLSDLITAATFDEDIMPLVERAKQRREDGRKAFDDLWQRIARALRNTIWVRIRCKLPEHVQAVEALAMEAIWLALPDYNRDRGFFLTWARAYATKQALWYRCRTLGAAEPPGTGPGTEDFYELPPSACYAELLNLVQDREPCHAVAFLLNKYLDWKPSAIAGQYADTPLGKVVAAIQREMVERYPVLVRVKGLLARVLAKAALNPSGTLRDCVESCREIVESITRWSADVKRSLANEIVSQAKDFLDIACELPVGAHERLAFIWNRFLRRTTDELCALAETQLLQLLEKFRAEYAGRTDLDKGDISRCIRGLKANMEKTPARRLADCSKGDLCADIVAWRERVQTILMGPARDRHLLAYSYLCGCLPGINGPAKGGI